MRQETEPELDIVLFGATGFVGRLVAEQLAAADFGGLRVGLAGRSPGRLDALQQSLGTAWPILTADSHDPETLERLARSARVVVSTVGPYAPRGLPLVRACAGAGTHYADLTGEPKFVRDSIDANQRHGAADRRKDRARLRLRFRAIRSRMFRRWPTGSRRRRGRAGRRRHCW